MLRFIVYRYISPTKIERSAMHHSSPSAITYPSPPQPYYPPHCPTTYPCPTPPSPTPHLPPPQPTHHPLPPPYDQHPTPPTTQLSIPDPPTLPMSTLHLYPLLRSHLLHILSRTPHTRTTLPHRPAHPPTDVPCHPMSYRLYHIALPRIPLSSI